MKVCKKCKAHVANKVKICKHCGADVSKAKIIKNQNTKNKSTKNSSVDVKKSTVKNVSKKVDVVEKKEVVKEKKQIKNIIPEKPKTSETVALSNVKKVSSDKKVLSKINVNKNDIKNKLCKVGTQSSKIIKAIFKGFDKCLDFISGILANVITYIVKFLNKFIDLVYVLLSQVLKYFIFGLKKIFNFISKLFVSFISFIKNCFISFSNRISYIKHLRKIKSINRKIAFKESKKVEKPVVVQPIVIEKPVVKPKKRKKVLKPVLISLFIITILGVLGYFGFDFYKELKGANASVIVSEKATTDKLFAIGDSISYNGVDYRITKVETSMGNAYKSPKSGNQFLIVYLSIKNRTDNKVPYSYENWTMSNSKGEEKKRIFTSINVQTALYSGELVIGGIKNGSIVFEQPINDKKLKMNFYELKKDKEGYDVADLDKRVFSVSIKVPDKKIKESNDKKEEKKTSVKTIKKKS